MPNAPQFELVRWRSWPCRECSGGASVRDYLVGRHEADGAFPSGTTDEVIDALIARERVYLREWVATCSHGRGELSAQLAFVAEGSEHKVFNAEGERYVLKLTLPGIYGDTYYLDDKGRPYQQRCTPGEYLDRMFLLDQMFKAAPEPIGITEGGEIVTLQEFIAGNLPTQAEVDDFMLEAGLEPVKQNCFLWKRAVPEEELEYWVGDARDENFVKTDHGLVPIDLRMWVTTAEE